MARPPKPGYVEWYFAFCKAEYRSFWVRWLRPDFSHCLCFAQSGNSVILAEPTREALIVKNYENTHAAYFARELAAGEFKVVRARYYIDMKKKLLYAGSLWPSCVNVVKVVSGYRCNAQTPYALYRHLIRTGGKLIGKDL